MATLNDYYRPDPYFRDGMKHEKGYRKPSFLRRMLFAQLFLAIVILGLLSWFTAWDNSFGEYSRALLSNTFAAESDLLPQLFPALSVNPLLNPNKTTGADETAGAAVNLLLPADGLVVRTLVKGSDGLVFAKGAVVKTTPKSKVKAAAAGSVLSVEGAADNWQIVIEHNDGLRTFYGSLAECTVTAGQKIAAGAVIGATGEGDLQFAVTKDGQPEDALTYLKKALNT